MTDGPIYKKNNSNAWYETGNSKTRNSSGDEIASVNFLWRHSTRTTAHNKVRFAYGKHTCP